MGDQHNHYRAGGTWGICDECGFKFRLDALRKRWDGMMVCSKDYETRHPQEVPRRVPVKERAITREIRPETIVEITEPVTVEDL